MSKEQVQTEIGKLLKKSKGVRDAIHIAVAPVIADEQLNAGEHIGLTGEDDKASRWVDNPIGVVDPFLTEIVEKGQRFYMFLYPNTITNLAHRWEHPSFKEVKDVPIASKVDEKERRDDSEQWLRNYAESIDTGYNALISAANEFLDNGQYFSEGGKFESVSTHPEFWEHFEIVTKREVKEHDRESFFSCAC